MVGTTPIGMFMSLSVNSLIYKQNCWLSVVLPAIHSNINVRGVCDLGYACVTIQSYVVVKKVNDPSCSLRGGGVFGLTELLLCATDGPYCS